MPAPGSTDAADEPVAAVARALRTVLAALDADARRTRRTTSSCTDRASGHERYHWYVEVIPRIAFVAGFEIGTGLFVNTVPPDTAADRLRAAAT